jgi:hypothetical protein
LFPARLTFLKNLSAYRWLCEKAEVVHPDISLNNIMHRKEDGEIYGVLSDYDLPLFFFKKKPREGPVSKQRMGTRPYMAIDLLQPFPTKHLYRHDLEWLFYVIVVLTSRYYAGKEIANSPLQAWFNLGPTESSVARSWQHKLYIHPLN